MKLLPNGIAVIEGDLWVSRWVEEAGRLCHDSMVHESILPLIKEGDWVVDAGAYIGDHTIAYAEKVGPRGKVIAFEINPPALECLKHNAVLYPQIEIREEGLSDKFQMLALSQDMKNFGASRLEFGRLGTIPCIPLDSLCLEKLSLLKIDTEGTEGDVLDGAVLTITQHKPIIVLEINDPLLVINGESYLSIFERIRLMGYSIRPVNNCSVQEPQYDIVCHPL